MKGATVDKEKISETLGTLALACLVFQLVLANKLQMNENLHDYLFLLIAGLFLAISLFSLTTVGVMLIVANLSIPIGFWYLGITGGALLLLSIFKVKLDWLISFGWLKLGEGMGFVMSKVVLGAVFYVFVSPLSVVYRIFNKNHMNREKKGDSYYVTRDHLFEKKDLTNTW